MRLRKTLRPLRTRRPDEGGRLSGVTAVSEEGRSVTGRPLEGDQIGELGRDVSH